MVRLCAQAKDLFVREANITMVRTQCARDVLGSTAEGATSLTLTLNPNLDPNPNPNLDRTPNPNTNTNPNHNTNTSLRALTP